MKKKQVDKDHYEYARYMDKRRWSSAWHQIDEILKLKPKDVLEVGPGAGILKSIISNFVIDVKTLDLDPDLNPDYVGSATELPLANDSVDLVCAFQVLEHLPFDQSKKAFKEMVRASRKHVLISLPDARKLWPYTIYIPKVGLKTFNLRKPFDYPKEHVFDGQHYWELNKKNYEVENVISEFVSSSNKITLKYSFRVKENPYHHFFVFEKLN